MQSGIRFGILIISVNAMSSSDSDSTNSSSESSQSTSSSDEESDSGSSSNDIYNLSHSKFDPIKALRHFEKIILPFSREEVTVYDNVSRFILTDNGIEIRAEPKRRDGPKPSALRSKYIKPAAKSHRVPLTEADIEELKRKTVGPISLLAKFMEKNSLVKVITRNECGIRGYMLGYIVAFDKHINIVLNDVLEVWTRRRHRKPLFIGDEFTEDIPPLSTSDKDIGDVSDKDIGDVKNLHSIKSEFCSSPEASEELKLSPEIPKYKSEQVKISRVSSDDYRDEISEKFSNFSFELKAEPEEKIHHRSIGEINAERRSIHQSHVQSNEECSRRRRRRSEDRIDYEKFKLGSRSKSRHERSEYGHRSRRSRSCGRSRFGRRSESDFRKRSKSDARRKYDKNDESKSRRQNESYRRSKSSAKRRSWSNERLDSRRRRHGSGSYEKFKSDTKLRNRSQERSNRQSGNYERFRRSRNSESFEKDDDRKFPTGRISRKSKEMENRRSGGSRHSDDKKDLSSEEIAEKFLRKDPSTFLDKKDAEKSDDIDNKIPIKADQDSRKDYTIFENNPIATDLKKFPQKGNLQLKPHVYLQPDIIVRKTNRKKVICERRMNIILLKGDQIVLIQKADQNAISEYSEYEL